MASIASTLERIKEDLVHMVMLAAAWQQCVSVDRISFVDTIRWLLSAIPGEEMPKLILNPYRPDRHEPRVIKDLQDTYRKMVKSRQSPQTLTACRAIETSNN